MLQESDEGNITSSMISITPQVSDNRKDLVCTGYAPPLASTPHSDTLPLSVYCKYYIGLVIH